MTQRLRFVGLLLIAVAVFGACTSSPEVPQVESGVGPVLDYVNAATEAAARSMGGGAIGVAVVVDGAVALAEAHGEADEHGEVAAGSDTVFGIGSVSKLFTAVSVMQLVEEGRVDLDQPFINYVPDLAMTHDGGRPSFTVRDVLSHHAGIPGDWFEGWTSGLPDADGWDTPYRELVDAPIRTTMEPRAIFSYSNVGYSLLGVLVERVSGMQLSDYFRENLFAPLGMTSASLYSDGSGAVDPAAAARRAYPYAARGFDGFELAQIRDVPAGSLQANVEDLGRFVAMVVNDGEGVVQPQTMGAMTTRQNADVALDANLSIGLGFWLVTPIDVPDVRLVSHGGAIPPFYALMLTAPDEGLGIIVVTSADDGAGAVYEIALDGMTRLLEAHRGQRYPRNNLWDQAEQPLESAEQSALEGFYASPLGVIEVESARRGRLLVRTPSGNLTLRHRGSGAFTPEIRILGVTVSRLRSLSLRRYSVAGEEYLTFVDNGIPIGTAIPFTPAPVTEAWIARTGQYEVVEPGVYSYFEAPRLVFDAETGLLLLEDDSPVSGGISLPLRVVNERLAVTEGIGRSMGEAVEVIESEGGELLRYSGVIFRRID